MPLSGSNVEGGYLLDLAFAEVGADIHIGPLVEEVVHNLLLGTGRGQYQDGDIALGTEIGFGTAVDGFEGGFAFLFDLVLDGDAIRILIGPHDAELHVFGPQVGNFFQNCVNDGIALG